MKKITALVISLIMLFSLSACSVNGKTVIEINENTEIDSEIFTYFLNEAFYAHSGRASSEYIDLATSECLEYVAVNTKFAESGEKLSQREKAEISSTVNALWRVYGSYYEEIGVSKDTFFKIKQYEKCKEIIRFAIYDKDGTNPINEEYIKQYFTSDNVGIKYFYQELYTPVSDAEYENMSAYDKKVYDANKQSALDRYNRISEVANYVNSSVYTMDEAFMAVTGEVSADVNVSAAVVGREGSSFSKEFVDAVFRQAVGSAFIITNAEKSYVYFIERIDLLDSRYGLYQQYRDECLVAVTESFLVNEITGWIASYKAVRHLSAAERCLRNIKKVDRSKYAGAEGYQFNSFLPDNLEDIK